MSFVSCTRAACKLQRHDLRPTSDTVASAPDVPGKFGGCTSQIRRIYITNTAYLQSGLRPVARRPACQLAARSAANGMAGDTGSVRGCRGMARASRSRACAARRARPATLRRREEDAPLMHILFLVSKLICCGVLFLHRCAVLFRDARLLAGELAQVVQLCAAYLADLVDRDAFDVRALDGEDTLNAGCP